jgi:hypothetical protein
MYFVNITSGPRPESATRPSFAQDFGQLTLQSDSLYWDDEEWMHSNLAGRMLALIWPEDELVDMDRDGEPEGLAFG